MRRNKTIFNTCDLKHVQLVSGNGSLPPVSNSSVYANVQIAPPGISVTSIPNSIGASAPDPVLFNRDTTLNGFTYDSSNGTLTYTGVEAITVSFTCMINVLSGGNFSYGPIIDGVYVSDYRRTRSNFPTQITISRIIMLATGEGVQVGLVGNSRDPPFTINIQDGFMQIVSI